MGQHLERLDRIHPDLIRVVNRLFSVRHDLMILEGMRSLERQRKLLALKATTTMKSRHLTGHAVDIGVLSDGELRWDWPLYRALVPDVMAAAKIENVPIEAGANWKNFPDGPHYQLPWSVYPISPKVGGEQLIS